ncbi:uncharacterized protein LOC125513358 isoform X1 [Triticum urartu]|uniref:uncharacterized protein LOC125513358 isoform X1 n=1 Tax=Triticum urartu TaxID=4572 RepID=UPI002043E8E5|nr:uncharacterized protein LOC125513358 isoform X1 [Triticum urartu]
MAARNFLVRSPKEEESSAAVREAVLLGGKNAAIAGTVVAVPTLVACRVLPWAKHNLNYTAQALIISAERCSCPDTGQAARVARSSRIGGRFEKQHKNQGRKRETKMKIIQRTRSTPITQNASQSKRCILDPRTTRIVLLQISSRVGGLEIVLPTSKMLRF